LTFASRRTEATGANTLRVTGDLVVHGTSREVVLEAEYTGRGADPWGGERIGLEARTSVDRTDFGLKWNKALETGGALVGNTVEITLEVEAIKRVG
jgi:polyisoprenoid-binding protein YceI